MKNNDLPEIRVIAITPFNHGILKALANLQIGDITIRNFRLVEQGDDLKLLPPLEYWDDGKPFFPLVVLSAELQDVALQAVLAAWAVHESSNHNQEEQNR